MSEELIRVATLRRQIVGYQESGPLKHSGNTVRQIGRLTILDPSVALLVAETIQPESVRINALAKVGSESKDIVPIVEAWEIAASEVVDDPAKKGRKLAFITNYALRVDPNLALEIALDNTHSPTQAGSLIKIADHNQDPELLRQANDLAARAGLGKDINQSLMWHGQSLNYEVGISALERRIQQEMSSRGSKYGAEDAAKDFSLYVLNCVDDAHEKQDYRRLTPISDEVGEAFLWLAEFEPELSSYELFQGRVTHSHFKYHDTGFNFMAEAIRLADSFQQTDPKASLKLLRAAQQLINTRIKKTTESIAIKRRQERLEPVLSDSREANLDDSSGLGKEFNAALAALERIGSGLPGDPTAS